MGSFPEVLECMEDGMKREDICSLIKFVCNILCFRVRALGCVPETLALPEHLGALWEALKKKKKEKEI